MAQDALATRDPDQLAFRHELTVEEIIAQAKKIEHVMRAAMEDGVHYGKIPGTPKPTLYKAGAEKLNLLFRFDPQYQSTEVRDGEHLTVKSICTIWHIPTGLRFGSGEGSCSTRESKYGYRMAQRACPTCNQPTIRASKAEWGGGWYCNKKAGGCGAKQRHIIAVLIDVSGEAIQPLREVVLARGVEAGFGTFGAFLEDA